MAFASGSAATATIIALFKTGDHVITIDDVYGGTNRYFRKISTMTTGINYSFVDFTNLTAFEQAFTPQTKVKNQTMPFSFFVHFEKQ